MGLFTRKPTAPQADDRWDALNEEYQNYRRRTAQELDALWYDTEGTWDAVHAQAAELDQLICAFNDATGLLKDL